MLHLKGGGGEGEGGEGGREGRCVSVCVGGWVGVRACVCTFYIYLVKMSDDLPYISVHPHGEEEHAAKLTNNQQQTQVMNTYLPHTLHIM